MAIDRGPWNALVDDDGSNLVGSIWNKAAIKTVLLDPIDVALGKVISNGDTGTRQNWAPAGFATQHTLIEWGGTADLTVGGLVAGVSGQIVTIKNRSFSNAVLRVPYYDAGSTEANRFLNAVTSAPTPIAAGGWVQYVYDAAWILVNHEQGAWLVPPFTAADYTGSGSMVWTVAAGHVVDCRYRLSGRTLSWTLLIVGSTTSGTAAAQLTRVIPGGFSAAAQHVSPIVLYAGSHMLGYADHTATAIRLYRDFMTTTIPIGTVHLGSSASVSVT